jgi:translation elongation factor EF-Ts
MSEQKPMIVNEDTVRFFVNEGVYKITQAFIYESNKGENRQLITKLISGVLDSFKEAGVLYDYKVVCDHTNNTPQVINNNELRVAVAYKLSEAKEYMMVDFIATRTDVTFAELAEDATNYNKDSYFNNRFKVVEPYSEVS